MAEEKILDIAHVSFLDMLRASIANTGPAATKGMLIRNALAVADKFEPADFASIDAFASSIDSAENPITRAEGKAVHLGDGVFGLPRCPFAASIGNYKEVFGQMPEGYDEMTAEYNKPGPVTEKHKIGHGAGVSPFCALHQPMRSALGAKVTIGGKPITIYQLGCKSGSGVKGFADEFISRTGVDRALVDKVLDDNMCCYVLRVEE